jgi:peroxiredoxin
MDPLIPVGHPAPPFRLPDLDGRWHALEDYRGCVTIVNFWSAECHWSERADLLLLPHLPAWGEDVALLPVASNANEPPGLLRQVSQARGLPILLHDADLAVADLYGATITPQLFVIDRLGVLRYQGAFDDKTFRRKEPTRDYALAAVEAVLAGRAPEPAKTDPYGCVLLRDAPL